MSSYRKVKQRRRALRKLKISLLILVICAILVFAFAVITKKLSAVDVSKGNNNISEQTKYYKSIQINEGDSLWSIARQYAYQDVDAYVKELKSINELKDDTIHSGDYIMVMYYRFDDKGMLACQE